MPSSLLEAHEYGATLEGERRYDEALYAYYRALRQDPLNPAIRLQIGQLQEKLGLYLDALETYQGIIIGPGEVMRGSESVRPARRERRRASLVARYRKIVLLGGFELARQWTGPYPTDRELTRSEVERRRLRESLRGFLSSELEHALDRSSRRGHRVGRRTPRELLAEPAAEKPDWSALKARTVELNELFALAALDALTDLRRRLRLHRADAKHAKRANLPLTHATIELTRLRVRESLHYVQAELGDRNSWPPDPEALHQEIVRIERLYGSNRWDDQYAAACVYSLPLLATDEWAPHFRDALAARAVERLERATAYASSGYVASRRDWLLNDDPDLDVLRGHYYFRAFEAMYLPTDAARGSRPRYARQLELERHSVDLLVAVAQRWTALWHRRINATEEFQQLRTIQDWWLDESEAWRLMGHVATNHRDWRSRIALVYAMRDWGERYSFEPLEVPYGRYEDRPLLEDDWGADEGLAEAFRLEKLLETAGDEIRSGRAPVGSLRPWHAALGTGRLVDPRLVAEVCRRHAEVWDALGAWLVASSASERAAHQDFVWQVTATDEFWATIRSSNLSLRKLATLARVRRR
jgi:hypothetical protein